jgi:hypothetical protein
VGDDEGGVPMTDAERIEKLTKCLKTGEIMRGYQQAYFKNRLMSDLQKAKSYETAFDKQVKELLHGKPEPVEQAKLL